MAGSTAEFTGVLSNLPYKASQAQIEEELKKGKVEVEKIELKFDNRKLLIGANVHVKSKEAAKALLSLNGSAFLGRRLKVKFPDLSFDLNTAAAAEVAPAVKPAVSHPKPVPPKEEEKKPLPAKTSVETGKKPAAATMQQAKPAESSKPEEKLLEDEYIITRDEAKAEPEAKKTEPKVQQRKQEPLEEEYIITYATAKPYRPKPNYRK